jgi:hypothetical protein
MVKSVLGALPHLDDEKCKMMVDEDGKYFRPRLQRGCECREGRADAWNEKTVEKGRVFFAADEQQMDNSASRDGEAKGSRSHGIKTDGWNRSTVNWSNVTLSCKTRYDECTLPEKYLE